MEPEIEYQLTAKVNGVEVYKYTSPIAEPVLVALSNAQDAVIAEFDNVLSELNVGNKMYESA